MPEHFPDFGARGKIRPCARNKGFQRRELTGDLGSGSTGGQIYLHDITRGEGTATSGFYLAIDRYFTGLDEHARLGAVLYQVR